MRGARHRSSALFAFHVGHRRGAFREAHGDGQAALGPGTDLKAGPVGFDDVGDNGQAEAEPVRPGGPVRGGASEGLEQTGDLVWRYRGPGVGHGEGRSRGAGYELDPDTPTGDVVTDGVVEQVRHQSVDEAGVPWHRGIVQGGIEL
jgi:hypothetical protein